MAKITPAGIIGIFVALVIGASLVSPLATIVFNVGVNATHDPSNVTGASLAIVSLLTLFFVIIVIFVAVKGIKDR